MIIVARNFQWQDHKMQDWFDKQDQLRFTFGLDISPRLKKDPKLSSSLKENCKNMCLVCYDSLSSPFALRCGHTFCGDCWQYHLETKITSGINECEAKCMQVGCNCVVPHSTFLQFFKKNSKNTERYWRNLLK